MVKAYLVLALLSGVLLLACSDDESPSASPTATATRPSGTPSTPGATATPSLPPVDGTVDPLDAGSTDPVTIKSNPDPITAAATLRSVRVGAHPEQGGWDRIVFEFADVRPSGRIGYAQQATQCGSGMNVPIPGSAVLLVQFDPANAHTEAGQPTVANRDIAGPGGVILQSRQICDFEAHVDWAIGLRSQQRFKVTTLSNPTRVVVDVKWP